MCLTDVKFDTQTQSYWDSEGNVVSTRMEGHLKDWDFPCRCGAPAKYRGHNSYYEYYDCMRCGNVVKVN